MLVFLPYARNEDGLGSLFFEQKPRAPAALSVVLLGIVGWFVLASTGLYTVFASIVITLVLSAFFKMKLGGATGDTLGATCEVVKTTAAISVSALVI